MLMLIKHWKLIAALLGVLGIAGGFWYYGCVKFKEGYNKGIGECEAQKQEAINENINTRKKQDGVIRLGDNSLYDSMRDRSY